MCNSPGLEDWVELPSVTPKQIQFARKIVHLFTGNLEQEVKKKMTKFLSMRMFIQLLKVNILFCFHTGRFFRLARFRLFPDARRTIFARKLLALALPRMFLPLDFSLSTVVSTTILSKLTTKKRKNEVLTNHYHYFMLLL